MENTTENTVTYEINNELFSVTGLPEFHFKLQNDTKFSQEYFQKLQDCQVEENFTWSRAATWLLIREFDKRKELFRNPKIKKRNIWKEIQSVFEQKSYSVSVDDLDRKLRNLKKTFKTHKDNRKKTGRGRTNWEYFEELDKIFLNDATVNIPNTLSSLTPSTNMEQTNIPETNMPSTSTDILLPCQNPNQSEVSEVTNKENRQEEKKPEDNVQTTPRKKRTPKSQLYELRKRQQDIEKDRVEETRKLRLAIESNNEIQRERNEILREIARNLKN